MKKPTPQQQKESMTFIAETLVAYTNTLDMVVRKPFSEHVQMHLQVMAMATQHDVEEEVEK